MLKHMHTHTFTKDDRYLGVKGKVVRVESKVDMCDCSFFFPFAAKHSLVKLDWLLVQLYSRPLTCT